MNIDVFLEAKELYDKYQLCEKVMEYLSDEDAVKGQKFKETLATFAEKFKGEFMTFVHEQMTNVGMLFEELHCCENPEQPETPTPPTEPKDPKFPIGSKVEIVSGIGKGDVGVVNEYDMEKDMYYVVSDKFYMWFAESELKAYEEEEENPDYHPTVRDFSLYDRVEIVVGALTGKNGTVVGLDAEENLLDVMLDGDEDSAKFTPSEVRKIEPENPEENGGGDTDPIEGE